MLGSECCKTSAKRDLLWAETRSEESMDKIIIEARVNELAPRDENPNVPVTPDEIIADAKA